MNLLAKISITCLFGGIFGAPVHASDLEDALSRLENWKPEYTSVQLREWSEIIRSQGMVGDPAVGKRLQRVITNEQLRLTVRLAALRLLCEKGDAGSAGEIVSTFTAWCLERGADDMFDQRSRARAALIKIAITEGLRQLERLVPDREAILNMLTHMLRLRRPWMLPHVCRGIAENPAPLELRRAAALKLVREFRDCAICPEPLVAVLGPEAFPALRELVRQTDDPKQFHYHAASLLAHLGDQEILPDLEAWIARLAEGGRGRYSADYAKGYIRRIKLQHPPGKLLAYIESTGSRWAMRRAMELGIPKSDVREALLKHAARLRASGGQRGASTLLSVKYEGLQLGVLEPNDLPDVEIPKGRIEY